MVQNPTIPIQDKVNESRDLFVWGCSHLPWESFSHWEFWQEHPQKQGKNPSKTGKKSLKSQEKIPQKPGKISKKSGKNSPQKLGTNPAKTGNKLPQKRGTNPNKNWEPTPTKTGNKPQQNLGINPTNSRNKSHKTREQWGDFHSRLELGLGYSRCRAGAGGGRNPPKKSEKSGWALKRFGLGS